VGKPNLLCWKALDATERKPAYQRSAETARFQSHYRLYPSDVLVRTLMFIAPLRNVEISHTRLNIHNRTMASFELLWQTIIEAPPSNGCPRHEARLSMRVCDTFLNALHPQPTTRTLYCPSKGGTASRDSFSRLLPRATMRIGVDRVPSISYARIGQWMLGPFAWHVTVLMPLLHSTLTPS
jgi:hypothetical protein